MRLTLLIHILAGGLGLVLGAVALSATKGEMLHRKWDAICLCDGHDVTHWGGDRGSPGHRD